MRGVARVAAGVVASAATCVAYGVAVERRWFRLREETLPAVTRRAGRMRLLHISDTHLARPDRRLAAFVAGLARLDPDLVVATGDLCGDVGAEDSTVELLATLTAGGRPGVAVLGSNDLYAPAPKSPFVYFRGPDARPTGQRLDTDRLRAGLRAAGWAVLENERTTVTTRPGTVEVAGLVDPHLPWQPLPTPEDVAARADDALLRLGVVHAPYRHALDLLTAAGYDLLLAGHTHGGQVRLPPFGALVTNCDLPPDRARGTSRWPGRGREARLHVSAGLGQSRYAPFRFACRPEASLLTLTG